MALGRRGRRGPLVADAEAPQQAPLAEGRRGDDEAEGGQQTYEVDCLDEALLEDCGRVARRMRERLSASVGEGGEVSMEDAYTLAAQTVARTDGLAGLPEEEQSRLALAAVDEMFLLGPLETLLADQSVTEVMVNAPDEVWVERFGQLYKTNVRFRNDAQVMGVVDRLATEDDRHCDTAEPMCNCTLHRPGATFDGSRVNLTVMPIAVDHPVIDIRKFRSDVVTPEALMASGEFDQRCYDILNALVRARMNVIVMGGTGSGKTTLLNALSCFIPDDERIITVEDTVELKLDKEHLVRMSTRQRSSEGTGEVTIRDLVINCLRQRPDRIIVGECRGEEAFDMLQAMSTGHDGSLTTIHANNARHALSRLQMMIQMSESAGNMEPADIMKVITDAVDIIVHVKRWPDGSRRVDEIVEVRGANNGVPTCEPLVLYDADTTTWLPTGGTLSPAHAARAEANGVEFPREWFACN